MEAKELNALQTKGACELERRSELPKPVGLGFDSTLLSAENKGILLFIKQMSLQERSNNVLEGASLLSALDFLFQGH